MIDLPNTPLNSEHHEAVQADIDAERAKVKASMLPEEQEKMTAIEQAAALLEKAKVPFVLWGEAHNREASGKMGYIRFNKTGYEPESTDYVEHLKAFQHELLYVLSPTIVWWGTSAFGAKHVVAYDEAFKPLFGYDFTDKIPRLVLQRKEGDAP